MTLTVYSGERPGLRPGLMIVNNTTGLSYCDFIEVLHQENQGFERFHPDEQAFSMVARMEASGCPGVRSAQRYHDHLSGTSGVL
jgi:hypothetical protein